MDTTYNEFEGTELDPSANYDSDELDGQDNDLLPIIGASAAVAAVAGGLLVLAGRKHNPQDQAEEIIKQVQKSGKKGAKAVKQAVDDAHLGDLLSDALDKAKHASGQAASAAQDSKLADLLDDALTRTRKAVTRMDVMETVGDMGKDARKGLRRHMKKAGHDLQNLHLDESVGDAVKKARRAASNIDVGEAVSSARKRASDLADNVDGDKAAHLLDSLKEKLTQAVESVREDFAPKAVDMAQSAAGSFGHTAQDAVDRVREDVIPAASDRVSQFMDDTELDKRARKAASTAKSGAGSLADMLRNLSVVVLHKAMDELLPEAKKAGKRAVDTARDDVIPSVAHTAGQAAQKMQDDVLPKVGDAASTASDVLGDILQMARERVDDVLHHSEPMASGAVGAAKDSLGSVADRAGDAAEYARHRAADAATFARHRAGDVAEGARKGKKGVTGAVSTAGSGVKRGVGGAAGATAHATRELTGILFWLSMLGGLVVLVFVPDREKQKELWNGTAQFLGELREMWRDLQGSDFEELPTSTTE